MNRDRTPTDGEPYYCRTCGLGFAEFIACEHGQCELESREEAAARATMQPAGAD